MSSLVNEVSKMGTFGIYQEENIREEPESKDDSAPTTPESKDDIRPHFECDDAVKSEIFSDDDKNSSNQVENNSSKAQDTCSIASSSSVSSSSSSASVLVDPGKKQHRKVLSPANENQNRTQTQPPSRIRRVPSTANPKYKIPKLGRTQRSHSQPHIQFQSSQSPRRNSSPNLNVVNVHSGSSKTKQNVPQSPNSHQSIPFTLPPQLQMSLQTQQSTPNDSPQQQQQVIYLQIPQPSQAQIYEPQALQQQISSQLQLLVPQIYSQLLSQISINSNTSTASSPKHNNGSQVIQEDHSQDNYNSEIKSQRVINQILDQNSKPDHKVQYQQHSTSPANHPKKQSKPNSHPHQNNQHGHTENSTQISAEEISKYLQIENISQILQQIPAHILQQHALSEQTSFIEIQQMPGFPKMTIPITQELLLQCQQFQQQRDIGFMPYQPRLETILEESMSVKRLKMNKFPKTKIIACILTILCVVVVVLLAGDKTVAVVVVAVVFIVFLLASIFYLYLNSSKSHVTPSLTHSDSQRIQVSALSTVLELPIFLDQLRKSRQLWAQPIINDKTQTFFIYFIIG